MIYFSLNILFIIYFVFINNRVSQKLEILKLSWNSIPRIIRVWLRQIFIKSLNWKKNKNISSENWGKWKSKQIDQNIRKIWTFEKNCGKISSFINKNLKLKYDYKSWAWFLAQIEMFFDKSYSNRHRTPTKHRKEYWFWEMKKYLWHCNIIKLRFEKN